MAENERLLQIEYVMDSSTSIRTLTHWTKVNSVNAYPRVNYSGMKMYFVESTEYID